ncbi:MAG: iron-containing redox enzyme family protein [Polyangiaceae bacterium]
MGAHDVSLNALGRAQLTKLWRALHKVDPPESTIAVFDILIPPKLRATGWPSLISDDHTPFELSVLFGGASPQVRLMAELLPLDGPVTLSDTIDCALQTADVLRDRFGADLSTLSAISDLFLPENPTGPFGLWLAASFDDAGRPAFKAYLNPMIRGVRLAPRLLEEACARLGHASAWPYVARVLRRGVDLDEPRFLSIDLERSAGARFKVYGFHHGATPEYLAEVLSVVPHHDQVDVASFARTLMGGSGVFPGSRQPATCLAFTSESARPKTGTLHIPIRSIAGDDAVAERRLLQAVKGAGGDPAPVAASIEAMADRPLGGGVGMIAWGAIRAGADKPLFNLYLSPRALSDEATRPLLEPTPPADDAEAVVRTYDTWPVSDHPFFARIAREPFNLRAVTLFVLNIREAITRRFVGRLASIIARCDDEAVRSILAKQLNDELGDGDPTRTHRLLFERFADGLLACDPQSSLDRLQPDARELAPGRAFGAVQDELYFHRSAWEGVGATLIMEVYGKQGDLWLGKQLARMKHALTPTVREWLSLHEELEIAHVEEVIALARLIPRGSRGELSARGARELAASGWAFLDALYELAFGAP